MEKRDFGNGYVGELLQSLIIIREIKLGSDFIPPMNFEFSVDTEQYASENEHFKKEFKELADIEGFGILVDKVVDLSVEANGMIKVTIKRLSYKVGLNQEEGDQSGNNTVVQLQHRSV